MDLIAYIRVSKVGGREGDSYQTEDQQLAAIKAIVSLTPGARLVGEPYIDRDQSGGTMDRPEVRKVIEMVESGQADGVVCAYLDRWARTLEALEMIERWSEQGKVFLSARERFDPTTAQGKFALGMMLLVAKYYRDQITERWLEAERGAISRGVHVTVPYGYRRGDGNGKIHAKGGARGQKLVPVEAEAAVVKRIFAERISGLGFKVIADRLNAESVPSPKGKLWNRQSVRAVIKVRAYMGEAAKGDAVNQNAHEALVSRADWQAAQTEPRKITVKQSERSLLVGIVRCGGCGYVMGEQVTVRGERRFNCGRNHAEMRCPCPTTAPSGDGWTDRYKRQRMAGLESLVTEAFLSRYANLNWQGGANVDPGLETAQKAAQRATDEFVTWRDDAEMRELIGAVDYRAGLLARKQAMTAAEEAVRDLTRQSKADGLTVDPAIWSQLDLAERRELVAAGVESVVVHQASTSRQVLADRVEIVWPGELDHDGSRAGIAQAIRNRPSGAGKLSSEDAAHSLTDSLAA